MKVLINNGPLRLLQVRHTLGGDATEHAARDRHPHITHDSAEGWERQTAPRSRGHADVFCWAATEVRASVTQGSGSAQLGAIDPVEVHRRYGGACLNE